MSVKYGLEGQVAVVTGAANGFGLAVATRLADEGAKLVLVDRDVEALNAAAEKLGGLAVVADVSKEEEVDGYVAAAIERPRAHRPVLQQRRHRGPDGPDDRAVGGGLRPRVGRQRPRRLHGPARRAQGDEAAGLRRHRQHRLDGGDQGRGDVLPVHRLQARGARPHQVRRARGRPVRHPGQLRRPRPHRHPDGPRPDRADQPGRPGGRVPERVQLRPLRQALRHRRRGRQRRHVAASPTRRSTSPAPCTSSTARSTPADERRYA